MLYPRERLFAGCLNHGFSVGVSRYRFFLSRNICCWLMLAYISCNNVADQLYKDSPFLAEKLYLGPHCNIPLLGGLYLHHIQ